MKFLRVWPGKPYPLGAHWDGHGVNFAIYSENATKVELCLFDDVNATQERVTVVMPERTNYVWHCYLPDTRPGQLYGYRVYGPYDPEKGHRFNTNKILLDPYAKTIGRPLNWHESLFGYRLDELGTPPEKKDLIRDVRDNAAFAPLAAVHDDTFDWEDDLLPQIPWHKTVIYEAHVKGMTMLHPDVPLHLRGTYLGMCSEPIIKHLKSLGVTSIEILPIHYAIDEYHLVKRGKRNYWGYNTLGYFAPDPRYEVSGNALNHVKEFKTMVKTFHKAGIEVILDVVYNHTAEGNHMGPTLSFRGIDNQGYYRLMPSNKRYYQDFTGCGNTLNMVNPFVLQMIMDSLRYWITEMHVDGFRFDLASALARELHDVDRLGSFFDIIHQDPIISQVKLIAEPWDLGEGGYQVGNFPALWTEWNGRYRDSIRSFWNGFGASLGDLAMRLTGSSDLYEHSGRRPHASINFITCHDGFTLEDLVSYNQKHNWDNGEDNRDGNSFNMSWNCGVEGATDNPVIQELRRRQKRNFMATLIFSLGVPMINSGDELSKTQRGNNNPYCQDTELSWLPWDLDDKQHKAFLDFVSRALKIRQEANVLHRRRFFVGSPTAQTGMRDITWFAPDGRGMTMNDWNNPKQRALGAMLDGSSIGEIGEYGEALVGDTLLMLLNAQDNPTPFLLPYHRIGGYWEVLLETTTADGSPSQPEKWWRGGETFILVGRSFTLLRLKHYNDPTYTAVYEPFI